MQQAMLHTAVYSVVMWVIITVPVRDQAHAHIRLAIYSEKFTSIFTAPMDLNIACKYRYAVKLWIDG